MTSRSYVGDTTDREGFLALFVPVGSVMTNVLNAIEKVLRKEKGSENSINVRTMVRNSFSLCTSI